MRADDHDGVERPPGGRSMTLRIGIDGDEPPSGVLIGDDDARVPFTGWLELMQAISHAVTQGASTTAPIAMREQHETGP